MFISLRESFSASTSLILLIIFISLVPSDMYFFACFSKLALSFRSSKTSPSSFYILFLPQRNSSFALANYRSILLHFSLDRTNSSQSSILFFWKNKSSVLHLLFSHSFYLPRSALSQDLAAFLQPCFFLDCWQQIFSSSVKSPITLFFFIMIFLSLLISASCSCIFPCRIDSSLWLPFRMVVSQPTERSRALIIFCYFSEQGVIQRSKSSSSSSSIMVSFLLSLERSSQSLLRSWLSYQMEQTFSSLLLMQWLSMWGGLRRRKKQSLVQFINKNYSNVQKTSRAHFYQAIPRLVSRLEGIVGIRMEWLIFQIRMSEQMRRMVPRKYYSNHFSQITFKTSFHNCVLKALQNRKWRQIETTGWHLQWSEKERVNDVFEEGLTSSQRCNHFRLWGQLCRKDMMIKNIRKHKRQLQKEKALVEAEWDFLPLTYFLPSEYIMFAEDFRKKGGLWIMKPTSRCQGQGIFIIDKLAQVAPFRQKVVPGQVSTPQNLKPVVPPHKLKKEEERRGVKQSEDEQSEQEKNEQAAPAESYLIQQYISRPLLFGSKKFDLRIYCLCTNYSQLTAWLYRSGFARFTHEPYNLQNIDNLESHLTNVEIQKHSENYDERRGGKWLIDKFKHYLLSRYDPSRVDWCFTEIKNIILRSLQSVQKSILPSKNSFELYGYDFMIDADLKPWLIEINGGPSMTANTDFDCRLKCGLIDDALTIVDIEGLLEGDETSVGGFDLIISKGLKVLQEKHCQYTSYLGAKNQRVKVMRHIVRKFLQKKQMEQKQDSEVAVPEVKEKKRMPAQGRQKLLPNFYYRRRVEDINAGIKQQLQEELQTLNENAAAEANPQAQFIPLKSY